MERIPNLHDLWAGRRKAMARLPFITAMAVGLGLFATTAPRAQGVPAPGAWVVEHGDLGHGYIFQSNGRYTHERFGRTNGVKQIIGREGGIYAVQGNSLILRPDSGGQQVLQWRIGPDPATIGMSRQPVLYLQSQDGGQEFFYPQ